MQFIFIFISIFITTQQAAYSACGANTRTWEADAGTTDWNTNNNWDPTNRPNATTENALIVSDWRVPAFPNSNFSLGCFEIASGSLTVDVNRRLTITGDYFKNIHLGSLIANPANTWEVIMQGTGDQDMSNVDDIPRLRINNPNTVNITESFAIFNRFRIIDGSGVINIDAGLTVESTAGNVTIPASATVIVKSGAIFTVDRNLTIDGVLKLEAGAKLEMGSGRTLTVNSGGLLQLDGSSGSIATIDSISGTYTFSVAGDVNLGYFSINRMNAAGMNVTGSIQAMSNGDFHYIATDGAAITLGAAASIPSSISTVGYFEEGASGTQNNIDASAYSGSTITFSDYSGIGGTANENDPSSKLDWGDAADPALQVTDASAAGVPASSIAAGTTDSHVATFSFSMTATAATATDITSIKFTLGGSNLASDIDDIKVMKDMDGNCTYDSGTDTQIGSTLYPTNSPASDILTLSSSEISVIDTTQTCIHILTSVNSTAQTANIVSIKIAATDDIANSQDYDWSASGSPPLEAGSFSITGAATKVWNGGYSGGWTNNNDWTPSGAPDSTLNCQIGSGYSNCRFPDNTERSCQNVIFQSSGTMDWQNRTTMLSAYGSLTIGSSYSFTSATNGSIAMKGSSNQSINADSTYPGDLTIESTGGTVSLDTDWQIDGDFTLTSGNFTIGTGKTLTVLGSVNINAGNFDIAPGGKLILANGRTLTVALGATLEMVGSASQNAAITSQDTSSAYSVIINGTIKAQYYSFSNLSASGVTINSGATIDGTNHLQNGSFTYPVANSATFLTLNRKVPTDTLDQMVFDSNGSGATGTQSIATSTTAGTLSITNYSGDRTDDAFSTNDPTYAVVWGTPTNTIKLTQEATGPASVNQGETYTMGRFGFQQTTAGAFSDTDITSITLTATGTGDASDISAARLYYDSSCSGSGGSLLGASSLSGTPAKATFSGLSGATIDADASSPPKRCIYVEVDIDSLATSAQTIGLKIDSSSDVTNSETYAFNGAAAPEVNLGTPATIIGSTTVWNGGANTTWSDAGNWSSGVPTSSINCIVNSTTNNPVITGTAICKSLTNGNGTITMGGASTLELYGSFENTGTFTQSGGTLLIRDNGATPTAQNISSTSSLESISFNKTAGGTVQTSGNLTITNSLEMGASNSFSFQLTNGKTLTLSGGLQANGATFEIHHGGTLKVGSSQSILVNGGDFKILGTNDAYPQNLSNKGKIEAVSGRYSFNASSGNVQLRGFLIDDLDTSGLNFNSSVNIIQIDGGQLRSLSTSYASLNAVQFNNSGSKPSLITNFGWQWDSTPANTEAYTVAASTNCGGANISFDAWFGNWYENTPTFDTSTKVSNSSCNITLDGSASPVSLTAFTANGFNNAIELKWATGLEFEHQGFNVYRSNSAELGFAQMNDKLIRNSMYSTTIHGNYTFHDLTAVNGETYYYMLEDISTSGARKWHGPISASALASAGVIPSASAGDIFETTNGSSGTPSSDDSSSTSPTPDMREIATNVEILSETSSAMRIKITVPNYSLNSSSQSGYDDLVIPGYSLTQVPGQAKLPYRTILINIPNSTSATYQIISSPNTTSSPHDIVPADEYIQSGNTLVPQNTIDTSYYSLNSYQPNSLISLGSIAQSSGRTILPLTVHPIHYNPSTKDIKYYSEVIVDVFLDGRSDWTPSQHASSVWGVEAGLKIGLTEEGLYKISYADLINAETVFPFDGVDINDIKLYIKNLELPIKINSANGIFDSGDEIIFYSPFLKNIYSKYTYLLLNVDSGSNDGLRMSEVSADPTSLVLTSETGYNAKLHFEENNREYFKEPYSSDDDHILWATFYSPPINAGDDFFTHEIFLDDLIQEGEVEVHAYLKGSRIGQFNDLTHHVSLWVNDSETSASVTFPTADPYYAIFKVPAQTFSPGRNKVQFQAKGTYISTTDLVDIDYFQIHYKKNWDVKNNHTEFEHYDYGKNIILQGFDSNQITVLDIGNITDIKFLTDLNIYSSASGFDVEFNQASGRKFIAVNDNATLAPATLSLTNGSNLTDTSNRANILYIGPGDLLDAISPLADYRESEGHEYKKIDIEDIYNEFGNGEHSAESIKSFIEYAHTNWELKPQYLVLLGDSTYDPKGQLGVIPRNSIPLKLLKGRFYDYGSDNWYVSFGDSDLPQLSVGRVPGNEAHQIESYANKVIDYEDGKASSSVNFNKQIQLIIDKDQASDTLENFDVKADQLKSQILALTPEALITDTRRSSLNDADTQSHIQNAFDDGRSIIHYLGHGAEDMWSDYDVFTNAEAKSLTNSNYPLVVSMNCLNSYFYYSDEADKGLAEELVLNPNGGAIAFWGSTSLTNPGEQNPFQKAFYDELLSSGSSLGDAIKSAKITGGANGSAEVLNSWTLIGDPLLNIKIIQKKVAPVVEVKKTKKSSGGGGGCTSSDRNLPWYYGLFELVGMLALLTVLRRFKTHTQRNKKD